MYVLLSGRWYRAKAESGPWTFVKADELPTAFAQIPPASDIGGLRTSVAGTPEADDAVREQGKVEVDQRACQPTDRRLLSIYRAGRTEVWASGNG